MVFDSRDSEWIEGLEHCVSVEFLLQYGDEGVVKNLHISYSQLTQSPDQRYVYIGPPHLLLQNYPVSKTEVW
jgi:hypothetical protein